jgi:hypothetical protein|mmetsp:Transcript_51984/g.84882  ORF Transcript_51984/g.84882 Transcript_51984/m.84882 type:complete len:102 (-) Transcript_51984:226-531(-)
MVHGQDTAHWSETQGAKHATNAIVPRSPSVARAVDIVQFTSTPHKKRNLCLLVKKNNGAKDHGAKMDGNNALRCLDAGFGQSEGVGVHACSLCEARDSTVH